MNKINSTVMRVSIARIRLYLKTGKTLSDGSHPIMLMCSFQGRKEISTGYSCTEKYWDKSGECVKKGFSNWVMINHEINKLKNEAIERRNEYERLGESYTPSMVLCPRKQLSAVTNDLKGLISNYISDKGLESKTIEKWWIVYRNVTRYYGREVIVNEIDESFCRKYGRWLEDAGYNHGSIRSYLAKIGAICHYAIGLGLMSKHPFDNWAYHKDYRDSKSELYIHSRTLDVMMEMFLDEMIDRRENGQWSYRDGVIERLMDIHSELYSHYLYMIGIWCKGISPVDISLLKRSDIKVVQIKGINCYAIDGRRSKTGMLYKVRVPQNCVESQVLVRTMLMFNSGEYFLPTLCDFKGDLKKRVNNLYTYHGEHLVDWFQRVNEEIAKRNVANGHMDDIPFIDLDCRYYSYRHSFIMAQIQKPTVNLLALAQTVGKSATTLHQYISLLGDVDLI